MFAKKMQDNPVKVGTVDLGENLDFIAKFHLRTKNNNLLFFEDGWYYNYTGKAQSREMLGVVEEKAYLMYDRRSYLEPSLPVKVYRTLRRYVVYLNLDGVYSVPILISFYLVIRFIINKIRGHKVEENKNEDKEKKE